MVRRPPLRSPALALLLAAGLPGQQPHRIGVFFWHDSPNDRATFEGIRRGFADAGARCDFVVREADSDADRAAVALRELREGGCELVFAMGTQAALLAERAITDRPVVFAAVSNPVASGVVPSWESSGRDNVCGATNWIAPQNVLEVFRLAVPGIARLGMLRSADAGVVSQAELATMRSWLEHTAHPRIEVIESVARTGRCVVVHEAPVFGGLGAEIAARVTEHCFFSLEAPVLRVGAPHAPYPPSKLEHLYLPDVDRILDAVDTVRGM